jgi:hypothetical protein
LYRAALQDQSRAQLLHKSIAGAGFTKVHTMGSKTKILLQNC